MIKTFFLPLLLLLFLPFHGFSQCLTAPPPPACIGTEPLISDGETLNEGTSKWYYGSAVTMNSLTLNGGTLVVCGDLTIDKFYMDSGIVFIRPGAHFVIGSGIGAGIIFRGKTAIYNYGTCEVQRNLSLDNGATASKPNLVINATSTSVFKMSNQYFVINNAFSRFVNNGRAEFWGIITDPQTSVGAVCLGTGSGTRMAVLINKVADSYTAPAGNACLYVFQYSEFYGRLTSNPTLFACLGSGHTSNSGCIPFGCLPNNWGSAQVFTNCSGCAAIAALSVQFSAVTATQAGSINKLQWQMHANIPAGLFTIMRSADGDKYQAIDSMIVGEGNGTTFNSIDKHPLKGNNYYMIRYNLINGTGINSKTVKVTPGPTGGLNLYPVPFDNKFYINYAHGMYPEKILLTDVTGRDIRTRHIVHEDSQLIEVLVLDMIQSGIYIVHLRTNKNIVVAKTIFKR